MKNNKKGFTILELVIVMAVIGILAVSTMGVYNKVIDKAYGSVETSNSYNTKLQEIIDEALNDSTTEVAAELETEEITVEDAYIFVSTLSMIPEEIQSDSEPTVIVQDNIIYVVGFGDMQDYTLTNLPEYQSTSITKIVVQDGIISIGDFAFFKMTGIEEVWLSSTVEEIGQYAFYNCNKITSINTDDLTKINKYAFYGCQGLTFTTNAMCEAAALEFLGDDQSAFPRSLAKVEAMKAYLNEVYLNKYPALGFDIDYCSDDDIELLQALADKITLGLTKDSDKAEAIYDWVRKNISYSYCDSFSAIDVYKTRKGICSGYSQLTATLFRLSDIPTAIVRAAKQGTKNITLGISNEYQDKNAHEFVVAYVDNDWYGYDATWGKDQPGVWSKMDSDRMADQYVVLHIDGIMTYSDEAWDYTTKGFRTTNTWYIDGEYICMKKGEPVLMGGCSLQVGGCLTYTSAYWYDSCKYYYGYLGTGANKTMRAYLGGYYEDKLFGHDLLYYQENGIQETEYFTYNNELYFNGVKVNNIFPDLGLTDNQINLYIGEVIDLTELYDGCTISAGNNKIAVDGTTITAVSVGTSSISINNGVKTYNIKLCITNYVGDELTQELCDHNHTHTTGETEICSYCGKVLN